MRLGLYPHANARDGFAARLVTQHWRAKAVCVHTLIGDARWPWWGAEWQALEQVAKAAHRSRCVTYFRLPAGLVEPRDEHAEGTEGENG
jgi:hypothetical protein